MIKTKKFTSQHNGNKPGVNVHFRLEAGTLLWKETRKGKAIFMLTASGTVFKKFKVLTICVVVEKGVPVWKISSDDLYIQQRKLKQK